MFPAFKKLLLAVGKLKKAIVPVFAVKNCKQPGGPPISLPHSYWITRMSYSLTGVVSRPKLNDTPRHLVSPSRTSKTTKIDKNMVYTLISSCEWILSLTVLVCVEATNLWRSNAAWRWDHKRIQDTIANRWFTRDWRISLSYSSYGSNSFFQGLGNIKSLKQKLHRVCFW